MLIESTSKYLLKKTRAKAKMIEYSVPLEEHIEVEKDVEYLFLIAVATIGNISASIIREPNKAEEIIQNEKTALEFSSKYFDSYLESQLDEGADDYYLLFGAVAYYLCNYIGSSRVLIEKINPNTIDLESNEIEKALVLLLQNKFHVENVMNSNRAYSTYLSHLQDKIKLFWQSGIYPDIEDIYSFRAKIYEQGSDLELLLGDAFCAIYLLKIQRSTIKLLPQYMNLDVSDLKDLIFNNNQIKELWPSQRKIGEQKIFAGNSAVIQLPTSSGKTKSISFIIASAFLSGRTNLAVVVAPFRALCREISVDLMRDFSFDETIHIDELSDVLKNEDISTDSFDNNKKTLLVATPEKLIYLLRQRSDLISQIGLIIFDEGHLFDEPKRGITYELLISTIKSMLGNDIQKILVSAIIPNAVEINSWLNADSGVVIADNTIKSTQKLIAITDWMNVDSNNYGYLYFLNPENLEEEEFYVPRLVPIIKLEKKPRESKIRYFPEVDFKNHKVLNNDVAIYYGLKLCYNGGVGIFCGKRDSANKILNRLLEIEDRGYNIDSMLNTANTSEVHKLCNLIKMNYGTDNIYYKAALKGAFVHHAGISNGIKASVEYAMRREDIKFIICTSTLAQGVNLPIRYLIISTIYQGKEQIKVRDFHNLIGRAGRSGIYTEGSVLLTESFVYVNRYVNPPKQKWKWNEYKKLININNSEPCSSRILFLIKSLQVGYGDNLHSLDMKNIIYSYYTDNITFNDRYNEFLNRLTEEHPELIDDIKLNIDYAIDSLDAIESFLMTYLLEDSWEQCEKSIKQVATETLAYHLAEDTEKENIIELFEIIGKYCIDNINNQHQRYICSRSLLGVKKMIYIQRWVENNIESIIESHCTSSLFRCIFECVKNLVNNKMFNNLNDTTNIILTISDYWIAGKSYVDILRVCHEKKFTVLRRNQYKPFELDDIVRICESILSYDITVILSAISEVVKSFVGESHVILEIFNQLSMELKYGVPYGNATLLYEVGFNDRIISQQIADFFDDIEMSSKHTAVQYLKNNYKNIAKILETFPSYYENRLQRIVRKN